MASTIVELLAPSGLTLTLELYPEGSDTLANGAGDTLIEETNRNGLYTATVTEALDGYYYVKVIDGSSNLVSAGWVKLSDDTGTYTVGERVVSIEGTKRQLDDLNDISVVDVLTTQMTESYAADGVAPTLTQAVMLIQQGLMERNVFQTTETVRKLDKTSTAATYTLNDATYPTDKTRAT